MMKHIHICLVSDQPVPNLTTILQFRPQSVAMLWSQKMQAKASRLAKAIKGLGIGIDNTPPIDPFDSESVIQAVSAIIAGNRGAEISANITGGTKISALSLMQAAASHGFRAYYVNTEGDEIIGFGAATGRTPIRVTLPIATYLAAHGFTIKSHAGAPDITTRSAAVRDIVAAMAETPGLARHLNGAVIKGYAKEGPHAGTITISGNAALKKLFERLSQGGLLRHAGDRKYHAASARVREFLSGKWLEEHVCSSAVQAGFDEVMLQVFGYWDETDAQTNEFDVLCIRNNRLYVISCKTGAQSAPVSGGLSRILYEIDSVGGDAAGIFGKRMLATSEIIPAGNTRKRAASMGIEIVDGSDLLSLKERMQSWMK